MNEESKDLVPRKELSFSGSLMTTAEQDRVLSLIEHLRQSNKYKGAENKADALALVIAAKDLNIPMSAALNECFILNGRVGISVHIAKALLLNSRCITWERIDDFKPEYQYSNGKILLTRSELPDNHVIVDRISGNDTIVNRFKEEGKFPVAIVPDNNGKPIIIDRVTTYKFTRVHKLVDNSIQKLTEISSFRYSDAKLAGLIKEGGAWEKYTSTMIDHRAFMKGARAIADDILLGMYSNAEVLDLSGVRYNVSDEGEVISVEDQIYEEVNDELIRDGFKKDL